MSNNSYIECGKIINTHGCKGGVKLESWCNTPDELALLKKLYIYKNGSYKEFKVIKSSVFKQFVVSQLEGINDMDEAIALKNTVIYADRNDFQLEEGEYFIADLVGVEVIDVDSQKIYGTLVDTINRGASDIYVIKTDNGEVMIPAVEEFIKELDIKNKKMLIRPIEGMFN